MLRTVTAAGVALVVSGAAHASDPIPPDLVGVWATDGAVLKGTLLLQGQAMYLGADGVGAILGGPPPIGFRIVATYKAQTSTVQFDGYEGTRRRAHGTIAYDAAAHTIDFGPPRHDVLHRRYATLSDETKSALGLSAVNVPARRDSKETP